MAFSIVIFTLAPEEENASSTANVMIVKNSGLGYPCQEGQFCGRLAECRDEICQCLDGFLKLHGECVPGNGSSLLAAFLKATSVNASLLLLPLTNRSTNRKQPKMTSVPLSLTYSVPGERCSEGQQCLGGSVCNYRFCVCPLYTRSFHMRCIGSSNSAPGDPCTVTEDCTGGSQCSFGFCVCPAGMESRNMKCVTIAHIWGVSPGGKCTVNSVCEGRSYCVDGLCMCPIGMRVQNGVCSTGVVASIRSKMQRKTDVNPGDKCEAGEVCSRRATCIQGYCHCPNGMEPKNGHCVRIQRVQTIKTAAPSQPCYADTACLGGSICDLDNNICTCAKDHYNDNGICRSTDGPKTVGAGELCTFGEVCTGGSACNSIGVCMCPKGERIEDGLCRAITAPSASNLATKVTNRNGKDGVRSPVAKSPGNGERRRIQTAAPCPLPEKQDGCKLPDCFCSRTGKEIPGGLPVERTPQFVVLTFDDAVNGNTADYYQTLFDGRYRNQNGCPVKGTFFVSHEWTNYNKVQWLVHQGHELATNSITHTRLMGKPSRRWMAEMEGHRRIMVKFANAQEKDIIGIRAPQMAPGGEAQFSMMTKAGFQYDNTISVNPGRNGTPYWPQTLDYELPWKCQTKRCPRGAHPGLWTIPINQFYGYYLPVIQAYKRANMIRAALTLNDTIDDTIAMLRQNFQRAYNSNRAPYILTLNMDFMNLLPEDGSVVALDAFLQEVLQKEDVYVVTLSQLLAWMRKPVPLEKMAAEFDAIKCGQGKSRSGVGSPPCRRPNTCLYRTPGLVSSEHTFKTCNTCPVSYPWINNIMGSQVVV